MNATSPSRFRLGMVCALACTLLLICGGCGQGEFERRLGAAVAKARSERTQDLVRQRQEEKDEKGSTEAAPRRRPTARRNNENKAPKLTDEEIQAELERLKQRNTKQEQGESGEENEAPVETPPTGESAPEETTEASESAP